MQSHFDFPDCVFTFFLRVYYVVSFLFFAFMAICFQKCYTT